MTKAFEYNDDFKVRKLDKETRTFHFKNKRYRFSEALVGQRIGLRETEKDGVWDICYCRFRIAQLDERTDEITCDRRLAEPRSARFG